MVSDVYSNSNEFFPLTTVELKANEDAGPNDLIVTLGFDFIFEKL
ncbi:MAG: hypothetical protein ACJA1A_002595 [Saprospiraceae bacterium]|jgi:hypothetical protein